MVLVLLAVLAVAVGAMLTAIAASGRTTGDMLNRRRAFYACDGMGRVVIALAQEYMGTDTTPTSAELREYVCQRGGGCTTQTLLPSIAPEGFKVTSFDISMPGNAAKSVIPSGPFQGMRALLQGLAFELRAEKENTGHVCVAEQSVTLAKIAMFQFFLFGDGYVDWFPGPPQDVRGRSHANGDFCFGSGSPFRLARVTSAGKLMHGSHPGCRAPRNGVDKARIATNDSFSSFSMWNDDTDHGCTTCGGTDLDWVAYAPATWRGNALDEAHGVQRLRLPITGTPQTQAGANATGAPVQNGENSRFLVDPVRIVDSDDVKRQKFACKADLRIINGVWYVRENPSESDPCDWPGTPIWSDHPGRFGVPYSDEDGLVVNAVGQGNLAEMFNWKDNIPASDGFVPARYSYYRTDVVNYNSSATMIGPASGKTPVISYGSLARRVDGNPATPPTWAPGHWVDPNAFPGASQLVCRSGTLSTARFLDWGDTSMCGSSENAAPAATRLLNATRSGFSDAHVEKMSPNTPELTAAQRSRVLPINFDVAAFRDALADTSDGELGSWFGPGSRTGRDFNGIVFITSTWKGSLNGFPDGWAEHAPPHGAQIDNTQVHAPPHGAQIDNTQVPPAHAAGQQMLPYPLCAPGAATKLRSDRRFDQADADRFYVPKCEHYKDYNNNGIGSRPNAVRVFNASTIDPSVFPKGLTIATNLPAYVLGQTNTSSNASSETATPWVPFLVAADQIMLLSDAWDDANAGWHQSANATYGARVAVNTTYNMAMLAGWAESAEGVYSGGIENFPRFLENWHGKTNTLNGSIVVGFNSVYWRWKRCMSQCYSPPKRKWSFDEHFNAIPNQPPGAPLYDVYAIRRWRR